MNYERDGRTYEIDEEILSHAVSLDSGLDYEKLCELQVDAMDAGIPVTPVTMDRLYNAYHANRLDEFLEEYPIKGTVKKLPMSFSKESRDKLKEAFERSPKFKGHVPRIINSIARVYDLYQKLNVAVTPAEFVAQFHIQTVQNLLKAGIPECQTVIMYMTYSPDQCNALVDKPDVVDSVCTLLLKGFKSGEQSNIYAANWMVDHNQTNEKLIKRIRKDAEVLNITPDDTVDQIEARMNNLQADAEVKKIEKAYKEPGFKLKDCKCELRNVGMVSEEGRYKAYIMHATDPRQVYLGYDTHCCQKLGDAGESAMMHGLLNPKAGFWVVEEKKTGLIKAQAEIWEENEDTIVFDNIELANDAELDLYRPVLAKWLKDCDYPNAKMGTGYNTFLQGNEEFRHCGSVTPTITPYEAYVLSYEDDSYCEGVAEEISSVKKAKKLIEEGRITYFDYVYCDSENHAVWLKEDGRLEMYFDDYSKQSLSNLAEKAQRYGCNGAAQLLQYIADPEAELLQEQECEEYTDEDIELEMM